MNFDFIVIIVKIKKINFFKREVHPPLLQHFKFCNNKYEV